MWLRSHRARYLSLMARQDALYGSQTPSHVDVGVVLFHLDTPNVDVAAVTIQHI